MEDTNELEDSPVKRYIAIAALIGCAVGLAACSKNQQSGSAPPAPNPSSVMHAMTTAPAMTQAKAMTSSPPMPATSAQTGAEPQTSAEPETGGAPAGAGGA